MTQEFNIICDRIVRGKAYPTGAVHRAEPYTAEWRQFGQHWPYTVPVELIEHCENHGFQCNLYTEIPDNKDNLYYAIGLGFFDFSIDYFALCRPDIREGLLQQKVRVLFYYHEGDSPYTIKARLDHLCEQHGLPTTCYRFVSGNTAADSVENFVYFPDHELLYWQRNRHTPALTIPLEQRPRDFTVLNRRHQWWRATVMADLDRNGLLVNSNYSYHAEDMGTTVFEENPIEIDTLEIRDHLGLFMAGAPYRCDHFTSTQQNDHSLLAADLYHNSYFSIVLETMFDADGSSGTFLTEKTFRCLKHGHPFVLFAPAGSLACLRRLGYRTYDSSLGAALRACYDNITSNTDRERTVVRGLKHLLTNDLHKVFLQCYSDAVHNQQVFLASKSDRLNMLSAALST
jgi:hypothetical protein